MLNTSGKRKYADVKDAVMMQGIAAGARTEVEPQPPSMMLTYIRASAHQRAIDRWSKSGRILQIFWGHDSQQLPIGRVVELAVTPVGLEFRAELDDDQLADAVVSKIEKGFIDSVSIGFEPLDALYNTKLPSGRDGRIITDYELFEISIVNWPADGAAKIESIDGRELRTYSKQVQERLKILKMTDERLRKQGLIK
jgi:HK97 family phage prohead protease